MKKTDEILIFVRENLSKICSNSKMNEIHLLRLENFLLKGEELPASMAHIRKLIEDRSK